MRQSTIFRLACLVLLLAAGSIAGCGGSTGLSANPGNPTGAVDNQSQHDRTSTANIVSVKMRPEQPVTPPFGFMDEHVVASAAPAMTASSFSWGELDRNGAQYNPALPLARVAPDMADPDAAAFTPNWDPGSGLNGAAFCIFEYSLAGFDTGGNEQTLGVNWLLPAVQKSNVWLGFANYARQRWDWYPSPDDGVLTIDSYAPYIAPTGRVLIALVVIGHDTVKLRQLHVGQLETRGIGDLGPAAANLYTLIPNILNWPLLPDIVDLSPGCAPINDQGQIGACTAFANVDSGYNYELMRTYGPFGWDFSNSFNRCSPRFVYNQTGVDLGGTCPTGGRTTNDVGTWLLTHGTATEMNAPFGSNNPSFYDCSESWSAAALADASLLVPDSKTFIGTDMGGGSYHWTNADIAIAKNVLKTLRHVIIFRTNVDSSFQWVNYAAGNTWTYAGPSIGGHAMCIVGYDTSKDGGVGAFKVRNSWGTGFGDNGYCWISFNSFRSTTAGVYGYYLTEDCNTGVISRFIPSAPSLFWPCSFVIKVMYTDKIRLLWDAVPGALRYDIFRDNTDKPIGNASAGETMYDDMQVDDFNAHVYWLQALNDQGQPSQLSEPVVGWRLPPTP